MARIPYPAGLDGTEDLPRTKRVLQNCFDNGKGQIVSRPGIELLTTIDGVARGQFVFDGFLYQVLSLQLIQITDTETGAFIVIGPIAGAEFIETDVGFDEAVIVVKGGAIYSLSITKVLTLISDNDNFVPSVDVAFINGRFVYIPSSGDPAFFSDVGDAGSVQPASFFDAETLPDKNNSVFNFKNTLYIGGTDSIELFTDTGATPNPFQRIDRARIDNGFIGGLVEYNETFLFIGREKGQDFGIYALGQGIAPKISNEAVDLILTDYTQEELTEATGARFKWRGHDIAVFRLERDAIGFLNGNWFILKSLVNGVSAPWSAQFITQFEGQYFTAFDDKIGILAKINTDYGEDIARVIVTGFESENNDWFTSQSIDMGISQGFNDVEENETAPTVALFRSRDNVNFGDPLFRELGFKGEYAQHLVWNYPGGLGMYDGFIGLKIYTTQDVIFNTDHLIGNFS